MTEPAPILTENQTIALLRAASSGAVPPLADPTATAIQNGRRRRRLRHAGRAGAGIALVAAASVVFTMAMPGEDLAGRSVVEPAQDDGRTPVGIVGPDEATAHAQSLRVLRKALGSDFARANPNVQQPFRDSLTVKPGSASAQALPADYGAQADVSTYATARGNICDPTAAPQRPGVTCTARELPDGRTVILSTVSSPLEASSPVELQHVYFVQADGDAVDVSLAVIPERVRDLQATVPRAAAKAWLAPFEQRLIAAATSPEMAPGNAQARERAAASPGDPAEGFNLQRLRDSLGTGFELAESPREPYADYVALVPGSAAARALPAGYTADARIDVGPVPRNLEPSAYGPGNADPAGKASACGDPAGPAPGGDCQGRGLDGGRQVSIYTDRPADHDPSVTEIDPGVPVELRRVTHLRTDDVLVGASLFVRSAGTARIASDQVPRDRIAAWLEQYEDALVNAVTDARVHSPARAPAESNEMRLEAALGPGWIRYRDGVEADPTAVDELPSGMSGLAQARVFVRDVPLPELCPAEAGYACEVRDVDDRQVVVVTGPVERWAIGDTVASVGVGFRRAHGEVVWVSLTARGATQDDGDPAEIDRQILSWLSAQEAALIRAATDPQMAQPPGYADPRV